MTDEPIKPATDEEIARWSNPELNKPDGWHRSLIAHIAVDRAEISELRAQVAQEQATVAKWSRVIAPPYPDLPEFAWQHVAMWLQLRIVAEFGDAEEGRKR